MGIPTSNHLFSAEHSGADSPDDPNLFTLSEMTGVVNVMSLGAKGDGVTDDTAAFLAAYNAVVAGGVIVFPPSATSYKIGSVDVSGKAVTVSGYGASILCTSANGAIKKTDHGNKLTVLGLKFTGTSTARAINLAMTLSGNTFNDYLIRDCDFTVGVYGIYVVGAREGWIQNCIFRGTNSGSGIYFQTSVSPFVEDCQFIGAGNIAGSTGIFYDGTGDGTDAGLVIENCEIMGWDIGLDVRYTDLLIVRGSTIDFNNTSVNLASQDRATFSDSYIGSIGGTAAVHIGKGVLGVSPDFSDKINFIGVVFSGHELSLTTYDNVLIDTTSSNVHFTSCNFTFYTRYGINYTLASTNMKIMGCQFAPRGGFTTIPIFNASGAGDANVLIVENTFPSGTTFVGSGIAFALLRENTGFKTRSAGAFVTDGTAGPFTIAHLLNTTPTVALFSALSAAAIFPKYKLTSKDGTNLVVLLDAAVAAHTICWQAEKPSGI